MASCGRSTTTAPTSSRFVAYLSIETSCAQTSVTGEILVPGGLLVLLSVATNQAPALGGVEGILEHTLFQDMPRAHQALHSL